MWTTILAHKGNIIDVRLYDKKLSLTQLEQLQARGPLDRNVSVSWQDWDEKSQYSLANDNTFVCLFDSFVSNGHDIGVGGGLTKDQLVYTKGYGTIAAAIGDKRSCTAGGGLYNGNCWTNFMSGKTVFTRIAKVGNIARTNGYLSYRGSYNYPYWDCTGGASGITGSTVATVFPATGTFYLCEFADGTNGYVGWSTTRPKKLSDIPVNQRIITTPSNVAGVQFYPNGAHTYQLLGNNSLSGDLYYEVWSKECLIDTTMQHVKGVRITGLSTLRSGTDYRQQVAEFEVYDGGTKLTGFSAAASGYDTSYPPSSAIDGNATTFWHVNTSPVAATVWLSVYRATTFVANKVRLQTRNAYPEWRFINAELSVSANTTNGIDGDWITIKTGISMNATAGGWIDIDI